MKRFITDIIFTLLFVAFFSFLYGSLERNAYTEKYSYFIEHQNGIKTLVMGNSLAEMSFNTGELGDSAWCFAISGRALYYDAELLNQHLRNMQNIQSVVLLLHYNLMTDVLLDPDLSIRKDYYIYNNYKHLHIPLNTFPYGWIFRSALLSNQIHYNNTSAINRYDEHGYLRNDYVYSGGKEKDNPPFQKNEGNAIAYLTKMSKTCFECGVRFIVVTPPFSDAWLEGCTKEGVENLTHITDSVNYLFPLEYKNYMKDSMFRNDSLYCNWNHLNHRGATLFAQRVKCDFGL